MQKIKLRDQMLAEYGLMMDSKTLCKVLYFPSVAALLAVKNRGNLDLHLAELPGRRGYFALTEHVAAYIESSFNDSSSKA